MCRLYSKSFCQKLNLEVALNLQLTFLQTYQELSKIRGINLKLPKILRLDSFEACIRWRMPRFHQILLKNSSSFFSLHTFRDITNIKNIYKYHKILQVSFFVIEKVFLFSTHNFKYYVRRWICRFLKKNKFSWILFVKAKASLTYQSSIEECTKSKWGPLVVGCPTQFICTWIFNCFIFVLWQSYKREIC